MDEYEIRKLYMKQQKQKNIKKSKLYPVLCIFLWGSIIYYSFI